VLRKGIAPQTGEMNIMKEKKGPWQQPEDMGKSTGAVKKLEEGE